MFLNMKFLVQVCLQDICFNITPPPPQKVWAVGGGVVWSTPKYRYVLVDREN